MTTLTEIAKICGVSISTVSNVLNGKPKVKETTKQRILEVVKETGYQPNYFAQGMRKQNTQIIGIIVEDFNEFVIQIVEEIMAECEDNGYRTILLNLRLYDKWKDTWYNDQEKLQRMLQPALQELLSIKVDGIVYVAGHCRMIECFPDDLPVPGIVAYSFSKNPKFPSVVIDDEKGGYDLTNYLIDKGHTKIGVIAGKMDNIHTTMRLEGYKKALVEHNIIYNEEWIMYGSWERESGREYAKELLQAGVTAIFCMNDRMAGGVYDYCAEHDLIVGKDVSLVGYDNVVIAEYLRPALTTNEIQLQKIGNEAADMILQMIKKTKRCRIDNVIKVPCSIVIRDSVK